MNSLAGGGGLFTFPLLLAFVSPEVADATSGVALFPPSITSTWGCRKELPFVLRRTRLLLAPSLLGGFLGALLLSRSSGRQLLSLFPWLVLMSTILILLRPFIVPGAKAGGRSSENNGQGRLRPTRPSVVRLFFSFTLLCA